MRPLLSTVDWSKCLCVVLCLLITAPPLSSSVCVTPQFQPVLIKILDWIAGWLAGKVLDYTLEQLKGNVENGKATIRELQSSGSLSNEDLQNLRRVDQQLSQILSIIDVDGINPEAARQRLRRVLRGDFDASIDRIRDVEERVHKLEKWRSEQENTNRFTDARVTRLEQQVFEDRVQFERNKYQIGVGYLFTFSKDEKSIGSGGFQGTLQYNYSPHVGVFVEVQYMELDVSKQAGFPGDSVVIKYPYGNRLISRSVSLIWRNWAAAIGLNWNVVSPGSTVSLQIGIGGGIFAQKLIHKVEDAINPNGAENSIAERTTFVALSHAELSFQFGPSAKIKPYLAGGFAYLQTPLDQSEFGYYGNAGQRFFNVSAGIRILLTD